jgi:hypothetical protein
MTLRFRHPVVVDGRGLDAARPVAWIPDGPVPSVFEFAQASGLVGKLADTEGRRHSIRLLSVLYLGGRIFAEPGQGRPRFGVLLRAHPRVRPGRYDISITGNALAPLRDVPIHAIPAGRIRALGGNLFFVVG